MSKNKTLLYFGIGVVLGGSVLYFVLQEILVKFKVVSNAKREWQGWGMPLIDINGKLVNKGGVEGSQGFKQRVSKYWKEGTGIQNRDGSDGVAWSSAFISYIMKKAGAGDKFVYNQRHSQYIRDSIANRKQNKLKEAFVGYRINEVAPKVGDLVCYHRENSNADFYNRTTDYKSHCDLVVKKHKIKLK